MDNRLFRRRMKMMNSSSDPYGDSAYDGPFVSLTVTICTCPAVISTPKSRTLKIWEARKGKNDKRSNHTLIMNP